MPEIPFAHQWSISENQLLSLKNSEYGCLCSVNVSNIPEFEYYMEIFPNGDNYERRGQTWIFLQLEFKSVKKVEVNWTFTIGSANYYSKKVHNIYEESEGCGLSVCATDDLFDPEKKFIVDGKFTMYCKNITDKTFFIISRFCFSKALYVVEKEKKEKLIINFDDSLVLAFFFKYILPFLSLQKTKKNFSHLIFICSLFHKIAIFFYKRMPEIPFAHQWSIDENQLLPLKDSVNGRLFSTPVSNIPEFEYILKTCPNGHNDGSRGQTWIFFFLKFKNVKKVETDFTFTIESANYSRTIHDIYEKSFGTGPLVCKTEEFFDPEKKYFVDGKFTLKVNGIFKFQNDDTIPSAIKEQKWIGGELGDSLWKKNDTKDFTIITADGKELKAHKYILDVRSDVFTAMLQSNMKEAIENKVSIPDFTFIVVEAALKLIYECTFTSTLTLDELMQLLQFFDKYLFPTLKAKVEPYLIAQISATTICKLTNCSILTNSFKLKEKCIEFLSTSFALKTPIAGIDELDKDVLLEMFKNSLFGTLKTQAL